MTTNPTTPDEDTSGLIVSHIDAAAVWTAESLDRVGHARLTLTPGDMTRYDIIIVGPGPAWSDGTQTGARGYQVAIERGTSYLWMASHALTPGYVAEHWNVDAWTARVLTLFLNRVWSNIVF